MRLRVAYAASAIAAAASALATRAAGRHNAGEEKRDIYIGMGDRKGMPGAEFSVPARFLLWVLFLVQMGCAGVFGLGQFWHMLSSTQGISITWFAAWEVFLILNLWLAWRAHATRASLVTGQTVAIYAFYAALIALDLSALLLRGAWAWDDQDTLTTALVGAGVGTTVLVGWMRGQSVGNPLVMGVLAIFFKTIPQLVLAWNIHRHGGSGLALAAIVAGHATILMRLAQLAIALREAGWDRNRIGSFISEVPNELSWIVVTVVWAL